MKADLLGLGLSLGQGLEVAYVKADLLGLGRSRSGTGSSLCEG